MEKFAWITNGLCVSFGGAPKPAFQGRQKELNVPSSLTDWSPNNCISNKQTNNISVVAAFFPLRFVL